MSGRQQRKRGVGVNHFWLRGFFHIVLSLLSIAAAATKPMAVY